MIKWLRNLLGLCEHKWKIIAKRDVTVNGHLTGTMYVLQCENCGNIKSKQVTATP